MVLKWFKRSAAGVSLMLMVLMLATQDAHRNPRRTAEYALFWTKSLSLEGGRYPGKYLPFLVFPVEKERLISIWLLEETLSLTVRKYRVAIPPHTAETPGVAQLYYTHRPPPSPPFNTLNPGNVWTPWGPRLRTIGEYFKYLQTPQASCKKLVRMGGTPSCKRNFMDGHKVTNYAMHMAMRPVCAFISVGTC